MLLRFDRWNIDNDLPGRHQETHPKLLVKVCNPTVLGPNHAQGHPKYTLYLYTYIYIYTSWIFMYDVSVNVWDLPLAPNHMKSPNSPTSQKSSLLAFDRKIGFFLFENTTRESFLNPSNATVTSTCFKKNNTLLPCLLPQTWVILMRQPQPSVDWLMNLRLREMTKNQTEQILMR